MMLAKQMQRIDHSRRTLVMSNEQSATVAEPVVKSRTREKDDRKPKKIPRYHVILWDDDDHSYEYVMRMMQELFAHAGEEAFEIAKEVDTSGRVICLTTTQEHAEFKRDQIHAFGRDKLIARCQGSMWATIEPVD